jgi:hypothetical protein
MIKPEEIMEFIVGDSFKAHMPSLGEFRKIHIVSVIDEGLTFCPMVVYRYWGKHRLRWFYQIEDAFTLTAQIQRAQDAASKCMKSLFCSTPNEKNPCL